MIGAAVRVGVVAGLVASVLAVGGARAEAQETDAAGLCDTAGAAQFQDVGADDYGAEHILCMRALGLSAGRADGTYGADRELTRAEMASFIVRLWRDVLKRACPDVETPFTDVDPDSVHAADIGCLYGLGITAGTTATTYEPQSELTASQISRFLARIYRRAVDTCGTAEPGLDEAVALLRGLRVIPSESEGAGGAEVTRAQMAVYLIGLWHNIAGRGLPPPPPRWLPEPAPLVLPTVPFLIGDFVNGRWLQQTTPKLAASINELGWTQDGVDKIESAAIQALLYTAVEDSNVASYVADLRWVQDGVDDIEADAIATLQQIAHNDVETAAHVLLLPWVWDGIDDSEADAIEHLRSISYSDAGAALRIAAMPFVATIGPSDVPALSSLAQLAASRSEHFGRVMSHPALRDGITDGLTPVVAALNGTAKTNPGVIDVLLDPGMVSLERRTVTLPLSGEVIVDVIRTGPGAARSMDLLEHSVRCAEEFMGVPLPTGYVGLLFEDAVGRGSAGTNFGTHIAVLPEYDTEDGSHRAERAGHIIAHEVAHYYWSGSASWIDEGAADLMGSISERARTGDPLGVTNHPCAFADSIAELGSLDAERDAPQFYCNYALGERLFVDLYRNLGEGRFRRGIRGLYLLSQVDDDPGISQGRPLAIGHVKEAFRSNDGTEDLVIARWYDGTEPHDLSGLDKDPVEPGLPSINGRIDSTHIVIGENGPPVSGFSARDIDDTVYLKLKFSYRVHGVSEVSLRKVEYYEDGLEFSDTRTTLTAEPRYIGGSRWWSVGAGPTGDWAPGRYWVYVYANGRKVAEAEYLVTP